MHYYSLIYTAEADIQDGRMVDNYRPENAAAFWEENRAFLGADSRNWKLTGIRYYRSSANGVTRTYFIDDEPTSFDIPNVALRYEGQAPSSDQLSTVRHHLWSLYAPRDDNTTFAMCKFRTEQDTEFIAFNVKQSNYYSIRISGDHNYGAFYHANGTQDTIVSPHTQIEEPVFVRIGLLCWEGGDPYDTNDALKFTAFDAKDQYATPYVRLSTSETKLQQRRRQQNPLVARPNFDAALFSGSSFSQPVTWTVWLGNEHDSVKDHEPYLKSVQSGIPMRPGIRLRQAASKDHMEAIVHSMMQWSSRPPFHSAVKPKFTKLAFSTDGGYVLYKYNQGSQPYYLCECTDPDVEAKDLPDEISNEQPQTMFDNNNLQCIRHASTQEEAIAHSELHENLSTIEWDWSPWRRKNALTEEAIMAGTLHNSAIFYCMH